MRTPTWRRAGILLILCLSTLALAGTATAMVQRETVPAAEAVFFDPDDIECLGEEVTLTGVVRITVQSTLDRRGILHFRVTSQPRNVKAVGSESGTLWLLRGQTTTAFKGVEDPETGEIAFSNFRFLNVFRVVGRAGEPSSSDHFLVHTTVNANGEVTAQVEHVRSTCR